MRGKDAPKDIAVLPPAPMQREVASPRRAPRAKPEKTAAAPALYVSAETVAQTTDENGRAVIPAPTVSATASRERAPELDNLSPISVTHEKPELIAEPYMPPTGRTAAAEPVSEAAPARDEIVVAAVADSQRTPSQPAVPRPAAQPPAAQRPANPAPPRSSSSPADSYALHLASYRGPETAEAGWDIYKEQFADVLASLRPVGVAVTLPEKGDYIRLLAGPISDLHAARLACEELAARDQYCQVMHYDGSSL